MMYQININKEEELEKVKGIISGRLIEIQVEYGNLVVKNKDDIKILDYDFRFRFSDTGLHIWDKNNLINISINNNSILEETDLGFNIENYIIEVM